ncbi:MAG: hypothetical protein ACLGIN_06935 [Candidatus Sericytochromatia bacterium]
MSDRHAHWLDRLAAMIEQIQPELAPVTLDPAMRLGEDLGLDSLAFEALFAALKRELPGAPPLIQWFNALEEADGRLEVLLELIVAQETAHAGH